MPETPSMATFEGWRGPLKEVKSEKTTTVSIKNETFFVSGHRANYPKLRVRLYGVDLGSGAWAPSLK